jgi:Protein of unknown function (DUF2975)
MNPPGNDLLLLAGKVLTVLMQGIMLVGGAAITFALFAVGFLSDTINSEIHTEYGAAASDLPTAAVLSLLALALVSVALIFTFFGKLRGIISTVAEGDPFVPENADRLTAMAWLLLAVYLIVGAMAWVAGAVLAWADQFEELDVTGTFGFDLSSILMIVTLFILARVFRQGAAMRADLEGTV